VLWRCSEGDNGGAVDAEESEFCFLPFEIAGARFFPSLRGWEWRFLLAGGGEREGACDFRTPVND
jgi:hypothetical protein